MAKLNKSSAKVYPVTHEGARASRIDAEAQLRRSVMACLLWERTFYEDGIDIADRIAGLVPIVNPQTVANIAIEAREQQKLRHVPLLIVREMARHDSHKHLVAKTLERVIQRADELTEFLAIYWKDAEIQNGQIMTPVSSQIKKGLANAFPKFDAYQLAKWNRDGAVKLRDVMFLCHPKPKDQAQAEIWKQLIEGTLPIPDTWEVALSTGKDKKETWIRLIAENKLGGLALLRNLRNMIDVHVLEKVIIEALSRMKTDRILPFRFIAAAKYVPTLEPTLEVVMLECLNKFDKLSGKTAIVVDVSGSMEQQLSSKSEMTRMDAACGLAIVVRELCRECVIISFSNEAVIVPARRGFALRDAIVKSQGHSGTFTQKALDVADEQGYDRIILITDEQSHQSIGSPKGIGYGINVGSYQNGITYGIWTHLDGWSENILSYIKESESISQ